MVNPLDAYCSVLSQQVNENLFGTAPRADVWLLLEDNRPWGAKALEESALSPAVKDWFASQLQAIPNARVQLIRQQPPRSDKGIRFYVAQANKVSPRLHRFDLATYDDLCQLDVRHILDGDSSATTDEKLFLVCVNGKRDRCCALKGLPLYQAMRVYGGESVWQTSHIGGHRFAPTLVCLPDGICYGRVGMEDVQAVIDSYRAGQMLSSLLRGRSGYDAHVQAAEYYLRQETGIHDLAAFRVLDVQKNLDEAIFVVDFAAVSSGKRHRFHLSRTMPEWEIRKSCGAVESKPILQYQLSRYEQSKP